MNAESIQEMRAKLAAQTSESLDRSPPLARKLSRWWQMRSLARETEAGGQESSLVGSGDALAGPAQAPQDDKPLVHDEAEVDAIEACAGPKDPLLDLSASPLELDFEIDPFAPRRSAFGQRSAAVAKSDPPRSLAIMGSPPPAAGEPAPLQPSKTPASERDFDPRAQLRTRRLESVHEETPFFPGDLDEPTEVPPPWRAIRLTLPLPAPEPSPELSPEPSPKPRAGPGLPSRQPRRPVGDRAGSVKRPAYRPPRSRQWRFEAELSRPSSFRPRP